MSITVTFTSSTATIVLLQVLKPELVTTTSIDSACRLPAKEISTA